MLLMSLNEEGSLGRRGWNGKNIVVFKQVPSHVDSNIIPEMQSLPDKAKDIIMDGSGFVDYTSQCLIYNKDSGRADSWCRLSATYSPMTGKKYDM